MRFEAVLGGRILYWAVNKKMMFRVEKELDATWSECTEMMGKSEAVQSAFLFAGFEDAKGNHIPESEITELIEKDPEGLQTIIQKMANNGEAPLSEAPLPPNLDDGADLA